MMDLDSFKFVNDSYGHPVGDKLLCDVAAILTATVRETDVVARIGGDEFAVLLREATEAEGAEVAKGLIAALRTRLRAERRRQRRHRAVRRQRRADA